MEAIDSATAFLLAQQHPEKIKRQMKVFTYFAHVPECRDDALLPLWKKSWENHGWETVILNTNDAVVADRAMYERFRVSPLLKCANPALYTLAATLRWIPMTKVTEPCLHVDWDVLCNGLTPDQLIIHDPVPTFLAASTCPCAVAANPRGWNLLTAWLEFAPFAPNFKAEDLWHDSCDQYATSLMPESLRFIQPGCLCKLYKEQDGWEKAPMIHFPNRLTPYPRSATVQKVLGL
jgi:hypothetical protein